YSIKVAEKDTKTNLMHRILIYDHSSDEGNNTVTYADSGYMKPTGDQKFLIATLYNGYSYKEVKEKSGSRRNPSTNYPAQKQYFEKQVIVFELKGFDLQRTDESFFKDSYQVLNLSQLEKAEDSLSTALNLQLESFSQNLTQNSIMRNPNWLKRTGSSPVSYKLDFDSLFSKLSPEQKQMAIARALDNARSTKIFVSNSKDEFKYRQKYISRHKIEWNRKFTLSFACFVFFFIGAPLGAIIRKGGLGMPVVISVLFFIAYYIITITGEKFARELVWSPGLGMWVSSFILLPLGIFLSYKATNDSSLMNADFYTEKLKKILRLGRKAKSNK
ncbi:MAG TPA: LptF/LptG family permease, partial [Tenuifilaceae bacterium]|nr:LptF/LptG family permease [Tenuifilaceae bacterium]